MKSNKGNVSIVQADLNGRYNSDQTGDTIDLKGYDAAHIIASFGDGGDTYTATDKVEVYLEESADGTTWTEVTAEHTQGAITGATHASTFAVIDSDAAERKSYEAHYIGYKPFIRTMANFIGTHSSGIPLAILAILRGEKYFPVA